MSKSPTSIQDERVIMEESKYRSEALLITEVALVLSIITKECILKLPPEASTSDWGLLALAVVYPFVRGLLVGGGEASHHTPQRRSKAIGGLVIISLTVAAIVTLVNYRHYSEKYSSWLDPYLLAIFGIVFIAMMLCNTVIYGLVQLGSRRAQKRIDRELGDE